MGSVLKCKVHNIAENNLNRTTSEFDLCILVTHYWKFSKSKGHNSAENYSTAPKFNLKLRILMTNLCTKFHLKISMYDLDNERKLNPEGRNDGRTGLRKDGMTGRGNTICPGHFMVGHKKHMSVFMN